MAKEVTTVSLVQFEQYDKLIIVTFEVLKKLGPKIRDVKALHSENMPDMLVTAEVSNEERLREVRALQ